MTHKDECVEVFAITIRTLFDVRGVLHMDKYSRAEWQFQVGRSNILL